MRFVAAISQGFRTCLKPNAILQKIASSCCGKNRLCKRALRFSYYQVWRACLVTHYPILALDAIRLRNTKAITREALNTYESCKSAVLYSRDNNNPVDSILQFRIILGFAVSVAELSNEYIEEDHNHHGHVSEDNQNRQPTVWQERKLLKLESREEWQSNNKRTKKQQWVVQFKECI